ncbi:DUF2807 domain-containing protein [Marinilabiliaceae bacterium JC017]|nr:DUF2807 domain-containing protein [Marinilabiliaceae bacterium JC017]
MKFNRVKVLFFVVGVITFGIFHYGCTNCSHQNIVVGNHDIIEHLRSVDSFLKVNVSGNFKLVLKESESSYVKIIFDSNLQDYIYTDVRNEELVVRKAENIDFKSRKSAILIVGYSELESLVLEGHNEISNEGMLLFGPLRINSEGSAKLNLNLLGDSLKCQFAGVVAGNLAGEVDVVDMGILAVGDLEASELRTNKFSIEFTGTGNASVNVRKELRVNISGTGLVKYEGNPENVYTNIEGIGKVINREM